MIQDHFKQIYANEAIRYDRMVGREDQKGNLFAVINEICPLDGLTVVDMGAGTGRITRILSLLAQTVYAFDIAPAMIETAYSMLEESGLTNWRLGIADNQAIPLPNACADLVIEGWSFGHAVGWSPDNWREQVNQMIQEAERLLKPNGTLILLETMGTGNKQPQPPTQGLADLYAWWEQKYGLQYRWVRTDYQFESVAEAEELTRFFFGDDLANRIRQENLLILPECTGVWWKTI